MNITINNEALAMANGVKVGDSIEVADKKRIPLDKYWRNRIKDSAIDGCVSISVKSKKVNKETV